MAAQTHCKGLARVHNLNVTHKGIQHGKKGINMDYFKFLSQLKFPFIETFCSFVLY